MCSPFSHRFSGRHPKWQCLWLFSYVFSGGLLVFLRMALCALQVHHITCPVALPILTIDWTGLRQRNFNANRLENKQHNADKGWLCSLASAWKGNQIFLGCAPAHRWGREDVSSRLTALWVGFRFGVKATGCCIVSHNKSSIHLTSWVFCFRQPQVDIKKAWSVP